MTDKLAGDALIGTFARRLVNTAQRRAWWVIAAYALLAVIALRYTSTHLGINTDTEDMIAEDLPWRQTFIDYHQAFPQFVGNLLIVIDGLTPELAEKAQVQVAAALAEDEELFARIYTPGAGEFFDRHGLLYLTTTELQDLSDNLVQLQPILGTLAQNPTLTGLADVFSLITKAPDDDFLLSLEKPLAT